MSSSTMVWGQYHLPPDPHQAATGGPNAIESTGEHRRARAGGRPRTSHNSNSEGTVMRDNHATPAHQRSSSAQGALR